MSGDRILLVMRHAKSSWKTNEPDRRRPLSGRGTRDAVVAGQTLAAFALDTVWCSPAARATQTWQCAQLGGASSPDVRTDEALYGASSQQLLDLLQRTPATARTVLLIAHEPGVSELILGLAAPSPLRAAIEDRFPTSAIAVLRHGLDWQELAPATCTLSAYEVPRG